MKERVCYVAMNPNKEEKEFLATRGTEDYVLPDGSVIKVCLSLSGE